MRLYRSAKRITFRSRVTIAFPLKLTMQVRTYSTCSLLPVDGSFVTLLSIFDRYLWEIDDTSRIKGVVNRHCFRHKTPNLGPSVARVAIVFHDQVLPLHWVVALLMRKCALGPYLPMIPGKNKVLGAVLRRGDIWCVRGE